MLHCKCNDNQTQWDNNFVLLSKQHVDKGFMHICIILEGKKQQAMWSCIQKFHRLYSRVWTTQKLQTKVSSCVSGFSLHNPIYPGILFLILSLQTGLRYPLSAHRGIYNVVCISLYPRILASITPLSAELGLQIQIYPIENFLVLCKL